jgi:hypothetical protein
LLGRFVDEPGAVRDGEEMVLFRYGQAMGDSSTATLPSILGPVSPPILYGTPLQAKELARGAFGDAGESGFVQEVENDPPVRLRGQASSLSSNSVG